MKRIALIVVIALLSVIMITALADETNSELNPPEAGSGSLIVDIMGETILFNYVDTAMAMTGKTYNFAAEMYTLSFMLDKSLKIGEVMEENSIRQIELISHESTSAGYYFTKKSSAQNVQSKVLLEEKNDDGLMKGTFEVVVTPADRWVGDMRPGMISELKLENGLFWFHE